jgi:tetratricopeptide (TPR) repeat protein
MALFGAPLALEDHAQRACHTALLLRDELRRYGDALRVERGLSFSVRMGINSGEVVVGAIGDDLRMDYTAQGHTVGLAARMEQLAEPGQALLTEHTARMVSGYFVLRDLGPASVKGVREPMRLYVLEGIGKLQTRFDASRARGLSRFVGREPELAVLEAALAEAAEGRGQVIGIVAEPGVGKSRLCYEFAARCRARGVHVYEAHGLPHGKAIPLLPWLELLRNAFHLSPHDGAEAARDKIVGRMLRFDAALDGDVPLTLDFLGVPDPARPAPRMAPEARQRQLAAVVRRLMEARSARGEVAVQLMDDLQWFDAASETFISALFDATAHTRTLLVANFRPEYRADWMAGAGYRSLPLQPLGEDAAGALLRDLLGEDAELAALTALVRSHTGGNPFFIEEAVWALVEDGTLAAVDDADGGRRFRLVRPITDIRIPATVQALLAARIDRLPEHEKAVLQTAAVIGKRFAAPLLQRVFHALEGPAADAPDIDPVLEDLARQELVQPVGPQPGNDYVFKHPLTQDVAYRGQLGDRRARVHAAVAGLLESAHAQQLDEHAAVLAHHWEAAGEMLEAARWHRRAAEWIGPKDRREATRHWKTLGALVDRLPTTPETAQLGALARYRRLLNAVYLGQPEDEQHALFAEGRALASIHGGPLQLMLMSTSYGTARVFAGAVRDGVRELREAMRMADESGDVTMRFLARASLVNPLHFSGQLHEALARSDEALALSGGDQTIGVDVVGFSPYVSILLVRSLLLMRTGDLDKGARELAHAAEVTRALGDVEAVGTAHVFSILRAQMSGDIAQARDDARAASAIAERHGSPFFVAGAHSAVGYACALEGEWAHAAAALERALTIVAERRTGAQIEPSWLACLADVYRAQHDVDRAAATAERAVTLARERGTGVWHIEGLLALARIRRDIAGRDAADAVVPLLNEASTLIDTTGAVTLMPLVHVEHAELARVRGDAAAQQHALRTALAGFTAIGAHGHAQRLAALLG